MRAYDNQISTVDTFAARDSDWEPDAELTHYIPAFTVFRGREQRTQHAACGLFVSASEHSAEPTCEACLAYVNADPYKNMSGDEVF